MTFIKLKQIHKKVIIAIVLVGGLIGVGYWAKRFMTSVAQFTVAGRKMGMWLGLSTGLAEGIARTIEMQRLFLALGREHEYLHLPRQ